MLKSKSLRKQLASVSKVAFLMAGTKHDPHTFRRLLYNFTQNTTFHGVRYITADTPFIIRRIIWLLLVLGAFSFFIWFMTDRLIYLAENPKAVDVEVIYTDNVTFPAVTICNQNLFRTSATLKLGLHDIVEESFKKLQNGHEEEGEETFDPYEDQQLEGMGAAHAVYVNVTSVVCRHACTQLHSDSCCSVLYERSTRRCLITPLDLNSGSTSLAPRLNTVYYKRRKCAVQRSASCTFEENTCSFVQDLSRSVTVSWKRSKEDDKPLETAHPPPFDHTLMTASGQYIIAATKFHDPNSEAQLTSPFILAEQDTCVLFFYQLRGGVLNVKLRHQADSFETIWSRSRPSGVGGWERAYQRLPPGYYRVVMEATAGASTESLNIAVDDLQIDACLNETELQCKETRAGSGYSGTTSVSASNKTCVAWGALDSFISSHLWRAHDLTVMDTAALTDLARVCRNPDDDPRGPWCFTEADTEATEYCDVRKCACREVEFQCDNGACLSRDLVCNRKDNCGDNSDEIAPCNLTTGLSCQFSDGWMCGYETAEDSKLKWITRQHEGRQLVSADLGGSRAGDVASLRYRQVRLPLPACLHVEYWLEGDVELDVSAKPEPHSDLRLHLCTLTPSEEGWSTTDILLSAGNYQLQFDLVITSVDSVRAYLDDILLLDENCTRTEWRVPSMSNETHAKYQSYYDFYNPVVENGTTEAPNDTTASPEDTGEVEVSLVPLNLTEIMYDLAPQFEILHEPYEHALCRASRDQHGNGTCRSCLRALADDACTTWLQKIADASDHLSSDCKHVAARNHLTLDECKEQAALLDADVINYHHRHCALKRCAARDDYRLVNDTGGHDVYAVNAPKESMGISCQFLDACACGYQFISSNILLTWISALRTDPATPISDESHVSTDWYMALTNRAAARPSSREWSRLVSPTQQIKSHSCLYFEYSTRFMNIRVYQQTAARRRKLLDILHDGQDKAWHSAKISLAPGTFAIVFETSFTQQMASDLVGIDNVDVMEGKCSATAVSAPFNCMFDDDGLCGYRDVSDGPVTWVRSKAHESTSPGGYYLRTSNFLIGKSSAKIVSPEFEYENISCLQFHFRMQSTNKEQWNILSVSLLKSASAQDWDSPTIAPQFNSTNQTGSGTPEPIRASRAAEPMRVEHEVIWRVRGVTDNVWHFAQQTVLPGRYSLSLQLSGDAVQASVDDVIMLDGECPLDINCTEEEYKCVNHFACIPLSNLCDGFPNCDIAEDENCAEPANETLTEEEIQVLQIAETHRILSSKEAEIDLNNLTDIYHRGGHQGEDFIYSCKWEGEPCSHANFTKDVTDYGLCYTFNSIPTPIKTNKTGSRFGLSLTINIEQYEYMRGPQNDAGIKVFLHSKQELPQVQDLGFAIAPGFHSLVAIRKNKAENLPPPWGDCAKVPLKFSTDYVHSRCLRECETDHIVALCGCRDAYMPGYSIDDPPVCNLSMYFSCAVPNINSVKSAERRCVCPKPCTQTIYESSLSQAALSVLSVSNILSQNMDQLHRKYKQAIEARHRSDRLIFIEDLKRTADIAQNYITLRQFAKTYLGDLDKSIFVKIRAASGTLVSLFDQDAGTLMEDLAPQLEAYNRYYKRSVRLILMYLSELDRDSQELSQLLLMTEQDADVGKFLQPMCRGMTMKASLAQNNIERFRQRTQNKTLLAADFGASAVEYLAHVPLHFLRRAECRANLRNISDDLRDIAQILRVSERWGENEGGDTSQARVRQVAQSPSDAYQVKDVDAKIRSYLRRSEAVSTCLHEYGDALQKAVTWRENARNLARELRTEGGVDAFNFTEDVQEIDGDEKQVEELLRKYAAATISKQQLLDEFDQDRRASTDHALHVNTFVGRILTLLTEPLRRRILRIRADLQAHYETGLKSALVMELFAEQGTMYGKASRMKIWRVPTANLEFPLSMQDNAREFWKVLSRDAPIQAWVAKDASRFIAEGLGAFCNPLLERLNNFEQQLELNKQRLLASMQLVRSTRTAYVHSQRIEHNFVLSNFLALDVYFAQLKLQNVKQIEAYQTTQFLGDVGGFMGLLLGGSALTVFELCDFIIFHYLNKLFAKKQPPEDEEQKAESSAAVKPGDGQIKGPVTPVSQKPETSAAAVKPGDGQRKGPMTPVLQKPETSAAAVKPGDGQRKGPATPVSPKEESSATAVNPGDGRKRGPVTPMKPVTPGRSPLRAPVSAPIKANADGGADNGSANTSVTSN